MLNFLAIHIGFLELRFLDVLDIVLVALLLFYVYKLLKGSIAFNIFIGIILLYGVWYLVKVLNMRILSSILGQFIGLGVLAFLVLFQPEIRRFLLMLGKSRSLAKSKLLRPFFSAQEKHSAEMLKHLTLAIKNMSKTKTGALIVLTDSGALPFVVNTGVALDANVSAKLVESIFAKQSPIHDGAIVLANQKIVAAGCTLPLSENQSLPKRVGTRHRAAVGITEHNEAISFVVSEETGNISVAVEGNLKRNLSFEELNVELKKALTLFG